MQLNPLMEFLRRAEDDRIRRQREARQQPVAQMPEWAKTLNPEDFTGETRAMLMKAQAGQQMGGGGAGSGQSPGGGGRDDLSAPGPRWPARAMQSAGEMAKGVARAGFWPVGALADHFRPELRYAPNEREWSPDPDNPDLIRGGRGSDELRGGIYVGETLPDHLKPQQQEVERESMGDMLPSPQTVERAPKMDMLPSPQSVNRPPMDDMQQHLSRQSMSGMLASPQSVAGASKADQYPMGPKKEVVHIEPPASAAMAPNPAPAAPQAQQRPFNSRRDFDQMGNQIDQMREMRRTGQVPLQQGTMAWRGSQPGAPGQPQAPMPQQGAGSANLLGAWAEGQSPSAFNDSSQRMMARVGGQGGGQGGGMLSGLFGGGQGGGGPGAGYMLGGIGALLQEAGGQKGAVGAFTERYQQRMAQAQELARFNNTVASALRMGIDPDYVMTMAETGDMKEVAKAIHDEQKFNRDSGKPTDEMREYQLYKEQGGTLPFYEYKKGLKQSGAQNITIDQRGETKFSEELGKLDAQRVDTLSTGASVAHSNLVEIDRMRAALESGRFVPGAFGAGRHFISQVAELAGIDASEIWQGLGDPGVADTLDAASKKMAAVAAEKLGRITNMSLGFIRDSLPALTRTPEGNAIIIEVMDRAARREIELAQLANDYVNKYGTLRPKDAPSFFDAQTELEKRDPVISQELKERIKQGSKEAPKSWGDVSGNAPDGQAPPEAIRMLQSDPSPEAQQEFDEIFGPGAAKRVLGGQ